MYATRNMRLPLATGAAGDIGLPVHGANGPIPGLHDSCVAHFAKDRAAVHELNRAPPASRPRLSVRFSGHTFRRRPAISERLSAGLEVDHRLQDNGKRQEK